MKNPLVWILFVLILLGGGMYLLSRYGGSPTTGTVTVSTLRPGDWTRGNPSAPVNLLEYGDFECPACGTYEPILEKLEQDLGSKLSFTFRHFPLVQIHPNALSSAVAAEAAGRQGKFWEMHDMLYAKQREWGDVGNPLPFYKNYAAALGLDAARFASDLADAALTQKVQSSMQEALGMGLNATPTFFVNGNKIDAPRSLDDFKALLTAASSPKH